jgi:hypothetical protein
MAKYEVITTEKRSYYIEADSSQEAEKKVIDGGHSLSEDEYTLDVESTEIEEDAEKGKMRVFFRDGSIVAAVDNDDSFAYRHYSKKATDHGFFADASSAASFISDPTSTGMATMSKDTYNEMDAIIDKPKEPEIEDNEPKNGNALAKLIGSLKF